MQTDIYWRQPDKQQGGKEPFEVLELEPGTSLQWEDDGGQIAVVQATTLAQPHLPAQGVWDKELH